jgi:CheY-like chemotaxis protein
MSGQPLLLLAEDEAIVAEVIEFTLREAGYDVLAVNGGPAAIAALENGAQRFAGVITDVRMIEVDGWQVARRARELVPDLPVVYMSGDSADHWTAQGVTAISSLLTRC